MVKIISKNKFVFCVGISYYQSCVGVLGFLQWPPEGTSRLFKPQKSAEFDMLNNGNLTSLNFDDSVIPTAAARGRTRLVAKKRRKSA